MLYGFLFYRTHPARRARLRRERGPYRNSIRGGAHARGGNRGKERMKKGTSNGGGERGADVIRLRMQIGIRRI
ncbi:hypothetical protein CDAR_234581 [Caerostris darwini]|uniref:Uncharacterized protein n=1 Tax=Caerostris darwini TaxID=1538125 RepID=A0AAV4TLE6_9ARAC|nr:hypothetical protein CDAR_234581 [Caerostris darwini]